MMTLTLEIPELIDTRIKDNPEGIARAQRARARKFAGSEMDAVAAIRESFTEEGKDITLEDAFASARAKIASRSVQQLPSPARSLKRES
jgi:hypothetical protein